ncbi:MAG: response regulator [Thiohalobacterales bacterium]|nr:response regulator [Thiohalobacterales bacterium]
MKILIVDDSRAMRLIVMKTLREAGYDGHDLSEAEDGARGLEAIKGDKPDLVLCDWNMPNMTGAELLQALTDEGIETTFGFVTTEATQEMKDRASELGASFMISKPFTPDSFRAALDGYIK